MCVCYKCYVILTPVELLHVYPHTRLGYPSGGSVCGKVHRDLGDAIGPIVVTYAPLVGCSVWNIGKKEKKCCVPGLALWYWSRVGGILALAATALTAAAGDHLPPRCRCAHITAGSRRGITSIVL
jgi:hypothetical protein